MHCSNCNGTNNVVHWKQIKHYIAWERVCDDCYNDALDQKRLEILGRSNEV